MIDLSSALPPLAPPAPPLVVAGDGAVASGGSFAQTLGAFLDAKEAALEPQAANPLIAERQAAAEPGKDLPVVADDEADPADPAAQNPWLAALTPPVPFPVAVTASPPEGVTTAPIAAQSAPPATAAAPETPRETPTVQESAPPQMSEAPEATPTRPALPTKILDAISPSLRPAAGIVAPKPMVDAPQRTPDASVSASAPVAAPAQAITVSTLPQPAGQVFASARAIAGSWRDRARGEGRDPLDGPASFATAAPIDLRERAVVQAAAQTANPALDLTADSGLQRMIDRIETLRDAADAGDTRVRLIPDALGSIDVAVRQEGERVHVHFTAEQDATRALIAEAQPRLTELAAARGVRIGDTSVSTGTGGGNAPPQPQAQPRAAPPGAPASALTDAAALSTPDHRLA
ncbi:flagellar hook-length control protein FliK [Sphingomonas sp. MMS24-J45]|uniref:flagellar hook-length control protein FliK n=1 Tax=Sphingomonas sp. MMS24-J45 TaxID=3238806 RepID=UPI00384CFDFD